MSQPALIGMPYYRTRWNEMIYKLWIPQKSSIQAIETKHLFTLVHLGCSRMAKNWGEPGRNSLEPIRLHKVFNHLWYHYWLSMPLKWHLIPYSHITCCDPMKGNSMYWQSFFSVVQTLAGSLVSTLSTDCPPPTHWPAHHWPNYGPTTNQLWSCVRTWVIDWSSCL